MTVGLGEAVLILVIYVLAVMRITRLINFDVILDRPRIAFARLSSGAADLIVCPWCVGWWVSLATAVVPIQLIGWEWWALFGVAPAASMLIGLLAPLSADDDVEVVDEPANGA